MTFMVIMCMLNLGRTFREGGGGGGEGEDKPTTHSRSANRQLTLKGCHPCYFILVCETIKLYNM